MSAKGKRKADIRRAGEHIARSVQADYPQVKTEIDFETVERDEDAYLWITVDKLDLLDEVCAAACNYAGDFWEAEDIFIVPRMRIERSPTKEGSDTR